MKKTLYTSLLAVIMIGCLQAYNVYLQYNSYIETTLLDIDKILYQSIDEECSLRSKKSNREPIGKQHFRIKVFKSEDEIPASLKNKKEPIIDLDTYDIKKLKAEGIVNSQAEVLTLINQDINETKKRPINLALLDIIVKSK